MAVERADVGCWIVKCNPRTGTDYFRQLDETRSDDADPSTLHTDEWCLSARSGRSALVQAGDPVALWVTGAVDPGVYEFGCVTDNRLDDGAVRKLHYQALRLGRADHVPRSLLQATPALAGCEQLRAPMMSNPSYLTVDETKALSRLLAARRSSEQITSVGWGALG